MKNFNLLLILCVFSFVSCKKEKEETQLITDYSKGVYVTNEGNYGNNNASITHISSTGEVTQDVYFLQNGVELGDVLQSFTVIGSKGYAVLNNSQKIEVIQLSDMKNVGTINGFTYPRYMVDGGNGTAYISDGSLAGVVHVLDLNTNTISQSISVGNGPENMVLKGNFLFVCNSGGWTLDNTVSVIDITTNSVVQTITTGDRPIDAVVDSNGDCWVLCAGETLVDSEYTIIGHTDAKIYHIDGSTFEIEDHQIVGTLGDHPRHLDISPNGNTIYFENNGVFKFDIDASDFDGSQLISGAHNSLNVNKSNGDIWCAGTANFIDLSIVYKYGSTGNLMDTYTCGIGSNGCFFN
jgi:YVTN family beta-propeller protein